MSLAWLDGFEDGQNPGPYDTYTVTSTTTAGEFRTGARAAEGFNTQGWRLPMSNVGTDPTEIIIGCAINVGDSNPGTSVIWPMLAVVRESDNAIIGGLTWGGNGDPTNKIAVADSTGFKEFIDHIWTVNGYDYFEVRIKKGSANGEIEVRINGTQVYLRTDLDTDLGGIDFEAVRSYAPNNSFARWDDLYILNVDGSGLVTFLGSPRVYKLTPTAEGASSDWTPSSGSDNALMVDETPEDGDTTYVEASVTNDLDLYTLSDLPAGPNTVHGIMISTEARKTTGDPASFQGVVRTGGSDFNSSSHTLSEAYTGFTELREENPDTSAPWTVAQINALEVGVEVV